MFDSMYDIFYLTILPSKRRKKMCLGNLAVQWLGEVHSIRHVIGPQHDGHFNLLQVLKL